jgi:ribosome-binding protein aMBF1 (putative translation factor)
MSQLLSRLRPCFLFSGQENKKMASFHPYLYEAALALCIEARVNGGLSQADLGRRLGHSEALVSSYEEGRLLLDPAEYVSICRAIGVDPYDLLRRAEQLGEGQSGAG